MDTQTIIIIVVIVLVVLFVLGYFGRGSMRLRMEVGRRGRGWLTVRGWRSRFCAPIPCAGDGLCAQKDGCKGEGTTGEQSYGGGRPTGHGRSRQQTTRSARVTPRGGQARRRATGAPAPPPAHPHGVVQQQRHLEWSRGPRVRTAARSAALAQKDGSVGEN